MNTSILHAMQKLWVSPMRDKPERHGLINLSSNTLMHPGINKLQREFIAQLPSFSEYASYDDIRIQLSETYQRELWQTGFTAGSDYLISVLMQLAKDLGLDKVYIQRPFYYNYESYANVLNIKHEYIYKRDVFSDDCVEKLLKSPGGFIFLISPCPLTGEALDIQKLDIWLEKMSSAGHFVMLDQAYAGFGSDMYHSLLDRHPSLFIFQTYSKNYGAAGLRFCHYFGPEIMIRRLKEYGIENTLSTYAISYAAFVHNNIGKFRALQDDIISWRDAIHARLQNENQFVRHNSVANFVSFSTNSSVLQKFIELARDKGIFLKKHLDNQDAYLRMTVTHPDIYMNIYSIFRELNHATH